MAHSLYKRSLGLLGASALAAALIFAVVGGAVIDRSYRDASFFALGKAAAALAAVAPPTAPPGGSGPGGGDGDASGRFAAAAAAFCARATADSGFRITLILPDGSVAADSAADPASMENHLSRPEVAAAMEGGLGTARRRSATLGTELLYAAAPLRGGPAAAGARAAAAPSAVLRIAVEAPTLKARVAKARWAILIAAAVFAAIAALAAAAFSGSLSTPIAMLAERARAYASGLRPAARPGVPGGSGAVATRGRGLAAMPSELAALELDLDSMASQLAAKIRDAEAQGRELEAILDTMSEAVLALDGELRVRLANPAALSLFGLRRMEEAAGRSLLDAARSSELADLARRCLDEGRALRAEIALDRPGERWFRALAAPFRAAPAASAPGLVLVLDDVTELRRLERVRRDFVANVSHELRTPVQVVKGFAESLPDMIDEDREKARRHAGIIARNASRMESLMADLLALASLERDGNGALRLEEVEVERLLAEATEAVAPKAEAKGIAIRAECPPGLAARLDPGLVVQALVNLLDNALKYSPAASPVTIAARLEPGRLVLEVRDRGIGIPAEDQGRLFERFYRVDKARSRELGGTGLGLAIVKHIALAHGGSAAVESWEGEGSAFRIFIPSGPPAPA